MKTVNDEGRVTSWTSKGENDFVACNIEKMSPYTAEKYVGLPNGRKSLGSKKIR